MEGKRMQLLFLSSDDVLSEAGQFSASRSRGANGSILLAR